MTHSLPICRTPACGEPVAEDWIFCRDCGEAILAEIAREYEDIDLEHHEKKPDTYDGETAMFQYCLTRKDKA